MMSMNRYEKKQSSASLTPSEINEVIQCHFRRIHTPLYDRLSPSEDMDDLIKKMDSSNILLSLLDLQSPKAIESLHLLSEQNNANAQYILAELYAATRDCYGRNLFCFKTPQIKQDMKKAFELFTAAAIQNHADALYRLADGTFSEVDQKTAFDYLQRAAQQDTSHSILRLTGWGADYPPECKAAALLAARMISTERVLSEKEQNQVITLLKQSVRLPKHPHYLGNEISNSAIRLGNIYSKKETYSYWNIAQNVLAAAYWFGVANNDEGDLEAGKVFEAIGDYEQAAKSYRKSTRPYQSGNEIFLINLYKKSQCAAVTFHTAMVLHYAFPENVELEMDFLKKLQYDFQEIPIQNPGKFYDLLEQENEIGIFVTTGGSSGVAIQRIRNVEDNFDFITALIGPLGCQALENYLDNIRKFIMTMTCHNKVIQDLIFSYMCDIENPMMGVPHFYPLRKISFEECISLENRYQLFKKNKYAASPSHICDDSKSDALIHPESPRASSDSKEMTATSDLTWANLFKVSTVLHSTTSSSIVRIHHPPKHRATHRSYF